MCNMWTWICGLRINRSSNLHHTPTETSCNGTLWLNMENLLLWDFRTCVHWDWNQLHYKQDECGICITIMHHMNVVVHKINSCYMISVIEFMNHGCSLSYMAVKQQFYGSSCWLCRCTHLLFAGSIPDGVIGIFQWHNPSGRTMALGSTQPLTEMSTRCISWG